MIPLFERQTEPQAESDTLGMSLLAVDSVVTPATTLELNINSTYTIQFSITLEQRLCDIFIYLFMFGFYVCCLLL